MSSTETMVEIDSRGLPLMKSSGRPSRSRSHRTDTALGCLDHARKTDAHFDSR